MRPPERHVRFVLNELECRKTEDSGGDEPYLWVLGFKVDAETLKPSADNPLIPSLNVHVFEGSTSRFVAGAEEVEAPSKLPIPAALGTREFRLKPANLPGLGWFPGIAGVICLLWDNDIFDADTREATYRAFRDQFGPALTGELNKLVNGDYDDILRRDASNRVVPGFEAMAVAQRLERLGDREVRTRAVNAIRDAITPRLEGTVFVAFVTEGLFNLLDRDDDLGTGAQVYLGNELGSFQDFSLRYTKDEADYTVRGHVSGHPVRPASLESVVTKVESREIGRANLLLELCFDGPQQYTAFALRQNITTRFELRSFGPEAPSQVRWLLNGNLLSTGAGSIPVQFEPVADYEKGPENILAPNYTGGPGILRYRADGPVLEIVNDDANGVFFGEVAALYAYPGDPPLTDKLDSGYDRTRELSIAGVNLVMDETYRRHMGECIKRSVHRTRLPPIASVFNKLFVEPGDPPPYRELLQDRVVTMTRLARAMNLRVLARLDK